jgi:hypothetical protein
MWTKIDQWSCKVHHGDNVYLLSLSLSLYIYIYIKKTYMRMDGDQARLQFSTSLDQEAKLFNYVKIKITLGSWTWYDCLMTLIN